MISLVDAVLRAQAEEHETRLRNLDPFRTHFSRCRTCGTEIRSGGARGAKRVICVAVECRRALKREEYARNGKARRI